MSRRASTPHTQGTLASFAWLPVAAAYKVVWSRVAKEEGWHTLALMRRVLPVSICFMVVLVPLLDPPGLLEYTWTAERALVPS